MYNRGLRPFQPVVYVTQMMKDQLEWKGHCLQDLFHFPTLCKCLGEQDILALLQLNSNKDNRPGYLCFYHPLGSETLMSRWAQTVQSDDSSDASSQILSNLGNHLKLPDQQSALEKALANENQGELEKDNTDQFEICHDESIICIVLKNNEHNLLNKEITKPLAKSIVKGVVATYNLYFSYTHTANSPWFTTYIKNL